MIRISPQIRIPLCIERGSVFNFYIEFDNPKRQSKNRYFVVLNRKPKDDLVLVMLTPTTKIEKTKTFVKNCEIDLKTVVEVRSGEHCIFTRGSVFNCNDAFEVGINDLIRKIEENGSMNYPKISENILAKLIIGIKASPRVSFAVKKLL